MKLQSYPEPAMAICCDLGLAIFIDKLLVIISFFFSTTVLGIYPHIPISLPPMRFWSMAPLLWKASGDIHCWIVWRLSPCVQQYQTEPMLHCLPPPRPPHWIRFTKSLSMLQISWLVFVCIFVIYIPISFIVWCNYDILCSMLCLLVARAAFICSDWVRSAFFFYTTSGMILYASAACIYYSPA